MEVRTGALVLVAGAQATSATVVTVAAIIGGRADAAGLDLAFIALTAAFLCTGLLLLLAGRGNRRASDLGAAFALAASSFSFVLLMEWARVVPHRASAVGLLTALQVEAVFPFYAASFFLGFPKTVAYDRLAGYSTVMRDLALHVGVLLLAVNLVLNLGDLALGLEPPAGLRPLQRDGPLYWPPLLLLLALAFAASLHRARIADLNERRRARLLVIGLCLGLVPLLLVNAVAYISPAFFRYVSHSGGRAVVGVIAYPLMIFSPMVVGYAVLVQRALDVRVLVRKALQYAIARQTLRTTVLIPLAFAFGYLMVNRERTLQDLLSGASLLLLAVVTAAAGAVFLMTRPLLHLLDRSFFREQYDARHLLSEVVDRSRELRDVSELGLLLTSGIERALHPASLSLLTVADGSRHLTPAIGRARPLELDSALAGRLRAAGKPISIDWEHPSSLVRSLPSGDADWIADGGFQLLVPVAGSDRSLLGVIALGERRSELPFSVEDQNLLTALAGSLGLALENRQLRAGGRAPGFAEEPSVAGECSACGSIHAAAADTCSVCGGVITAAEVPRMLAGKYEFIARVGTGGMGVVYRCLDRSLDREVAIKSLPRLSPRNASRLRREARVLASVSHRNLETIYAVEGWRGIPMLVLEYLPRGTLEQRLLAAPLQPEQALAMGSSLAGAAARLHEKGIIHRDIKPANIGFDDEGVPKLMDFGVARMLAASQAGDGSEAVRKGRDLLVRTVDLVHVGSTVTLRGAIVGTPLYMSPETIQGAGAHPSADLWALAVVLYESIAGVNPFESSMPFETFRRIVEEPAPDIREFAGSVPEAVAEFFRTALALDPRERPRSARALAERLHELTLLEREQRLLQGSGGS